ncbi:MAG: triose-phosphate isomerase [Patescibacteria group bacterium]
MKPLIVANWKCKPATSKEAVELFNKISEGVEDARNVEVVICPPFIYLPEINNKYHISLGAQNCFLDKKDVSSQVISPQAAKEAGCEYIIIGHSSRRIFLGETDEIVNRGLKDALFAGLLPIFCTGETNKEREMGRTEDVLERQIRKGLDGISASEVSKIVITYEPVWAISEGDPYKTKEIPTPENIKKAKVFIENILKKIYGSGGGTIRIIYGGSANADNSKWILEDAGMDGLLVGGASLDPQEFLKIVKNCR